MIDLYTGNTPNGQKISIMLEEVNMTYNVHKVDLSKGEQFAAEFVALNPNSKIPVIVDRETGITIFESGAILIYLAEKAGKLLPSGHKERFTVLEWLMFQVSGVGPMFGQLGYFVGYADNKNPDAIERYKKETLRLAGVLDKQLGDREFICGDYSIADIATFPWINALNRIEEYDRTKSLTDIKLDNYPHVKRWLEKLQQRPEVQRGMAVPV